MSSAGLGCALHALRLKRHLLQEATATLLKVLYYSLHLTQDSRKKHFCPECYENLQRELENNILQLSSQPINVEHAHMTSHTVQGIDMLPIPRPMPRRKNAPEIPEPSNPLPGMPVPTFPDVAIPIVPELPVPEVPEFPMPMEPDKAPKKEPLPGEKVKYFLNSQDKKKSTPDTQDTLIDFRLLFTANNSLGQNEGAKSNFKSYMEDFTSISNYDLISQEYEIPEVLMMPVLISATLNRNRKKFMPPSERDVHELLPIDSELIRPQIDILSILEYQKRARTGIASQESCPLNHLNNYLILHPSCTDKYNTQKVVLDSAIAYDLKQQTFRKIAKLPDALQAPAVCAHENEVYVVGLKNIYKFIDIAEHQWWEKVADTKMTPNHLVSFKGYIYVAQNYFCDMYRFKPGQDVVLQQIACFTHPPLVMCSLGNTLFAITGTAEEMTDLIKVEEFQDERARHITQESRQNMRVLWTQTNWAFGINPAGSCAVALEVPPANPEVSKFHQRYLTMYGTE